MENSDTQMGMLAALIAERCFQGKMPDAPEIVAFACLEAVPALRGIDDQTAERFFRDFTRACRRYIDAQNNGRIH